MARVKDLWFSERRDSRGRRKKTKRHPDNGGTKEAKRWLAVWIGPDGKEKSKAFDKKVDAEKYGAAQEVDVMRGVYVDERRGRITFADYVETKWLPAQLHLKPNTISKYKEHLRTHILPAFGGWYLGRIERDDVQNFVIKLTKTASRKSKTGEKLTPDTIEGIFNVLRTVLQSAVDNDRIGSNPCRGITLPTKDPRIVEPLPAGAVLALVESITPRYRLAVWLGAGLGLRLGEALGLTVPKVDFLRRRVTIHRQAQNGKLVDVKTKASRRVVPADDMVLAEITRHMQRDGWAEGPERALFTNLSGTIPSRATFWESWVPAVERAGLPKGTRFHDLRHFYASTLIRANLNPKSIQARLGHSSITETMDTYGHLFPDDEDLGRGAIETMITDALRSQTEQGRNTGER